MMGDAFAPVNLYEQGSQEARGEQARMVRTRAYARRPALRAHAARVACRGGLKLRDVPNLDGNAESSFGRLRQAHARYTFCTPPTSARKGERAAHHASLPPLTLVLQE